MHAIYDCLRAHSTHVLADQNEDSLFSWNAFIVGHTQLSALNSRCHSSATILCLHQNLSSSPSVSHRPSQGIPICTIFLILLQTGEICLDILKDAWAPVWTLKSAYRNHWLCWITPRPRARSTAVQALLTSQSTAIDSSPHAGNLIRCDDRRGFFCTPAWSRGMRSIVSVVRFFASRSGILTQSVSLIGNHSFLRFGVFISKVPMHGLTSLITSRESITRAPGEARRLARRRQLFRAVACHGLLFG